MAASMSVPFLSGVLKVTAQIIPTAKAAMPGSYMLTSTDGGRKIEFSIDGTNFFQPTYDQSPAGYLVVAALAPIAAVRFTGAVNDPFTVL